MTFHKQEIFQITIGLVCYREKEDLALVLEDIKRQTLFKQVKEIILFQNGTCQITKKVAESFRNQLPLVFLSSNKNNLGLARARIVEKAQTEWIAFTDSDCRLKENWLEILVQNKNSLLDKYKPVALGGPNRLPENKFWKKMINLSLDFPIGHAFSAQAWQPKKARRVSHIPTTNGFFLKSACLKAGNFSEKFPFVGEDLELGKRLKKQGALYLFPRPIVINNYASSYANSLKRLYVFARFQKQNKGLFYYLTLFFLPLFTFSFSIIFIDFFFPISKGILKTSLLFLSFYFLLLWIYSFRAFIKTKKLSSFLLVFFYLAQHISYSLGVNREAFRFSKGTE